MKKGEILSRSIMALALTQMCQPLSQVSPCVFYTMEKNTPKPEVQIEVFCGFGQRLTTIFSRVDVLKPTNYSVSVYQSTGPTDSKDPCRLKAGRPQPC